MKKLASILMAIILVGCQAHQTHKPPIADKASLLPATTKEYMRIAVSAIQFRFYDIGLYSGKVCQLNIHQKDGQLPDSVIVKSGDTKLCEAAIATVQQAISEGAYPYKPSDPTQHFPDDIPIEFAPE